MEIHRGMNATGLWSSGGTLRSVCLTSREELCNNNKIYRGRVQALNFTPTEHTAGCRISGALVSHRHKTRESLAAEIMEPFQCISLCRAGVVNTHSYCCLVETVVRTGDWDPGLLCFYSQLHPSLVMEAFGCAPQLSLSQFIHL